MSKDDKRAQAISKLFPVTTIKINGVPIEVRPLRHGVVCQAIDFFYDLVAKAASGEIDKDIMKESVDTLNSYMNQCITIPDVPDFTIEDLPEPAIPELIRAFLEHTLKPGNWRALAQNLQNDFGISLSQGPTL